VTITGPKGTETIDPSNAGKLGESISIPGLPPGLLPAAPGGLFLDSGSYTVTATSGADVGAFSVSFQLPATVEWTNQPSYPSSLNVQLPRDQDLLFQWRNGNDPDLAIIQGFGLTQDSSGAAFICTELASKGSFTVPAFVLSSIPATPPSTVAVSSVGGGGFLSLGIVMGNPGRFKNDQLDLGFVTFSSTTLANVGGWR
jgi:hypothetical protein